MDRAGSIAATTDLSIETRTDKTTTIVERIVSDIDSIVKIVRFPGWQTTVVSEREVQKILRNRLPGYQLHKEGKLY